MWWLPLFFLSSALGDTQVLFNKEPEAAVTAGVLSTDYEERWLDVRLNQFDASNTETFPMRYLYNSISGTATNIIIFVGGEWAIGPGWVTSGLAHDLAIMSGASLFYTEHRYYGLTRPTDDTTLENLRYLTVDQALADLAQFITYVKSHDFEGGRYSNALVGLVGCSYAGTMATWMRVQYPHLVDAAFSDSGPLRAQEDFYQYWDIVGDALRQQGSQECFDTVNTAIQRVTEMLATPTGPAQVSQIFNTCTPLSLLPMDIASFHWFGLIMPFGWLAQTATIGDVSAACGILTDTTVSADPVERLAAWLRPRTQPCVETRYTEVVEANRNTSFDSPASSGRAWLYQTCVEYGWYQSTSGSRHPFGSGVPVYYFHQLCQDIFSANQNQERLRYGIARTNLFFGALHVPDRVVTAQGQFDPWHAAGPGPQQDAHLTRVFFVPEISHCRIIYSVNNSETEAIADVKRQVLNEMSYLMFNVRASSAASVFSSMVLVLGVVASLLFM